MPRGCHRGGGVPPRLRDGGRRAWRPALITFIHVARSAAGRPQRRAQLPPVQQRAYPRRDRGAAHGPDCSAGNGPDQTADDVDDRREDHRAQAAPRGTQSVQARAGAGNDAPAHDGNRERQH